MSVERIAGKDTAGGGVATPQAKLLSSLPRKLYVSRRCPDSDKISSEDLELAFNPSEEFLVKYNDVVDNEDLRSKCRVVVVNHRQGRPFLFDPEAGRDRELRPPEVTHAHFDVPGRVLRVRMDRKNLPISSKHSGAPFRLVFNLNGDHAATLLMEICAKQAKKGTKPKGNAKSRFLPPSEELEHKEFVASTLRRMPEDERLEFCNGTEAPPSGRPKRRKAGGKARRASKRRSSSSPDTSSSCSAETEAGRVSPFDLVVDALVDEIGGKRQRKNSVSVAVAGSEGDATTPAVPSPVVPSPSPTSLPVVPLPAAASPSPTPLPSVFGVPHDVIADLASTSSPLSPYGHDDFLAQFEAAFR